MKSQTENKCAKFTVARLTEPSSFFKRSSSSERKKVVKYDYICIQIDTEHSDTLIHTVLYNCPLFVGFTVWSSQFALILHVFLHPSPYLCFSLLTTCAVTTLPQCFTLHLASYVPSASVLQLLSWNETVLLEEHVLQTAFITLWRPSLSYSLMHCHTLHTVTLFLPSCGLFIKQWKQKRRIQREVRSDRFRILFLYFLSGSSHNRNEIIYHATR